MLLLPENKLTSPGIFITPLLGQHILEEWKEGGIFLTSVLQAWQVIFYSKCSFCRRVRAMKGIS